MSLPGPLIAIVGPTASGKSSLAECVAMALDSAVVSVDAMQVYRGMDIGTAKTPVARRRCPLLMVDVADICEAYSVRLYQEQARGCVDGLLSQGKVPVLCGGTGLYLDALIDEMNFPKGETGSGTRKTYEQLAKDQGPERLHALLEERDAASAALIHPHNVRRVVRALEMADEGISYAENHAGLKRHIPHYDCRIWGITRERAVLYQRIDARVDQMLADGLVKEVYSLMERGLDKSLTAGQAIGYKELLAYITGTLTFDEVAEIIKKRTRNYAKRQLSWLRRDGRVRWINADHIDEREAADMIVSALRDKAGKL